MLRLSTALIIVLAITAVASRSSPADPTSPDTAKLVTARVAAASDAYAGTVAEYMATATTRSTLEVDLAVTWSERWLDAALEAGPAKQAFVEHLARMQKLESKALDRVNAEWAGAAERLDLAMAKHARIQAELWNARGHK
jgi:hypothetical protein